MQSYLLEVQGITYEFQTAVKELVIDFNVHRRKNPMQKDTVTLFQDYI